MNDGEVLAAVKAGLLITGEYQDEALRHHIREVRAFLLDAGVSEKTLNTPAVLGIITRGVADLMNMGSGEAELSPYFLQRAAQLTISKGEQT